MTRVGAAQGPRTTRCGAVRYHIALPLSLSLSLSLTHTHTHAAPTAPMIGHDRTVSSPSLSPHHAMLQLTVSFCSFRSRTNPNLKT